MPTVISHGLVAVGLALPLVRRLKEARLIWISVLCAILPDADVLSFAMGIPYDSPLGHRGVTHSLAFAALLSLVLVRLGFREVSWRSGLGFRLLLHFFVVTASHGVLDAMTNGGLGVALLAPMDQTRYFLPWRPIQVSPIGVSLFSSIGTTVLASELRWIWLPEAVALSLWALGRALARWGRWSRLC